MGRSVAAGVILVAAGSGLVGGCGRQQPAVSTNEAPPERAPERPIPWSVRETASGIEFNWDRTAQELKGARNLELVVQSGRRRVSHRLASERGMIIVPFGPQPFIANLRVQGGARSGRTVEVYRRGAPSAAERARTNDPKPEETKPSFRSVRIPTLIVTGDQTEPVRENSRATIVLPPTQSWLARPISIDVYFKVNPGGRVASVSIPQPIDPLHARLGQEATQAILQWRFNPVRRSEYRDARVRLIFSPTTVAMNTVQ